MKSNITKMYGQQHIKKDLNLSLIKYTNLKTMTYQINIGNTSLAFITDISRSGKSVY